MRTGWQRESHPGGRGVPSSIETFRTLRLWRCRYSGRTSSSDPNAACISRSLACCCRSFSSRAASSALRRASPADAPPPLWPPAPSAPPNVSRLRLDDVPTLSSSSSRKAAASASRPAATAASARAASFLRCMSSSARLRCAPLNRKAQVPISSSSSETSSMDTSLRSS